MARKKREKKIILPGLFWDGEQWIEVSKYPNYVCFTDRVLAEVLGVSKMRVQTWRASGTIPFSTNGNSFAVYSINAVIKALKSAGYKQDLIKKSKSI